MVEEEKVDKVGKNQSHNRGLNSHIRDKNEKKNMQHKSYNSARHNIQHTHTIFSTRHNIQHKTQYSEHNTKETEIKPKTLAKKIQKRKILNSEIPNK